MLNTQHRISHISTNISLHLVLISHTHLLFSTYNYLFTFSEVSFRRDRSNFYNQPNVPQTQQVTSVSEVSKLEGFFFVFWFFWSDKSLLSFTFFLNLQPLFPSAVLSYRKAEWKVHSSSILPHPHPPKVSPIINILYWHGTFITTDEPILMHYH